MRNTLAKTVSLKGRQNRAYRRQYSRGDLDGTGISHPKFNFEPEDGITRIKRKIAFLLVTAPKPSWKSQTQKASILQTTTHIVKTPAKWGIPKLKWTTPRAQMIVQYTKQEIARLRQLLARMQN